MSMKEQDYNGKTYYFVEKRAIHSFNILKDLNWHTRTEIEDIDENGNRKYGDPSRTVTALEESGFNIERGYTVEAGQRMQRYKLNSLVQDMNAIKKRTNITKKMKTALYERDNYTCVVCKIKYEDSFLEPDHKIPIQVESDDIDTSDFNSIDKLQTMCKLCNGRKREICKKCTKFNCSECIWGDPKKFAKNIVRINDDSYDILKNNAADAGVNVEEFLDYLIKKNESEL